MQQLVSQKSPRRSSRFNENLTPAPEIIYSRPMSSTRQKNGRLAASMAALTRRPACREMGEAGTWGSAAGHFHRRGRLMPCLVAAPVEAVCLLLSMPRSYDGNRLAGERIGLQDTAHRRRRRLMRSAPIRDEMAAPKKLIGAQAASVAWPTHHFSIRRPAKYLPTAPAGAAHRKLAVMAKRVTASGPGGESSNRLAPRIRPRAAIPTFRLSSL